MVNVVCMKWGTLYGPEYVNVLRNMVARHLSLPHRFVCLTECPEGLDPSIEVRPLPPCHLPNRPETQAWRKISLFAAPLADLEGSTLFLDLDVVVTDSLDPFFAFEPGRFCIIHNWTHPDRRVGNSSVFRFEAGQTPYVFEEYERDPDKVVAENRTEQIYVTQRLDAREGAVWWPEAWCKSFTKHSLPKGFLKVLQPSRLPEGCHVLVFHGSPNPPEAIQKWRYGRRKVLRPFGKFMRPARWLAAYWR